MSCQSSRPRADGQVTMTKGEARPATASLRVPSPATLTITGTPTITIYDDDGRAVLASTNVTGKTTGAALQVLAWYVWDTTDIAPGTYRGVFTIHTTDSGGGARTYKVTADIIVTAAY